MKISRKQTLILQDWMNPNSMP